MKCYACEASTGLPFKCKFCSHQFCDEHRLPEDHNCSGLKSYKEKRLKELRRGKRVEMVYSPSKTRKSAKSRVSERFEPLLWMVERNPDLFIGLFLLLVLVIMLLVF
jgi:hypothetical protein